MSNMDEEAAWRQHFPTYHFEDRDIALEEYRSTSKTLEAEERLFLNAANISIVIGAAFGSLALGKLKEVTSALSPQVPEQGTLTIIILVAMVAGVLFLRHFANRQKAIVFAARKVIVLRRMLGMSYGRLQLVLPNWRIEGADEPFAIRLFPGWSTYVAFPCYAIAGISSVVVFFVSAVLLDALVTEAALNGTLYALPLAVSVAAGWFIYQCWLYRKSLLDTHERTSFLVARGVARFLRLSIDERAEYVIYRANLATHELHRLGVNLSRLKSMAVQIEDKEYFSHGGWSVRGLARMILSILHLGPRSGGSTITQQLVRTLFIYDQHKLIRRKIVEILLAIWVSSVISKERQLEMYLAAVRFEYGAFGVVAACKYFFGDIKKEISNPEAFFLIERLSNVRSRLLGPKVLQTLRRAVSDGVLSEEDIVEIVDLYRQMVKRKVIQDDSNSELSMLEEAWPTAQPSHPADAKKPRG
ncbi:MAG: penicillin-binding protein [Porticoccus sp.]|nr:penicillin-binding protein [Porticoccus sp.]